MKVCCFRIIKAISHYVIFNRLSQNIRESAEDLLNLIDLTNQTTGDAISDMLIVQAILSHKKWTCEEWGQMYVDLPNRQDKVKVSDRTVIITNDDETRCLSPNGLQDAIDQLVSTVPNGRSFVRPSGTEDIVRVYAEAETKELAKKLSVDVAQKVYDIAGGIGNRPS
jgi:phosphoacetylglucosamine mutase